MTITNSDNQFIFQYGLEFVRLSEREQENFNRLMAQYGSFKNFPNSELVSVCITKKIKNRLVDEEDYFFVQANELTVLGESVNKRRKSFLGFNLKKEKVKQK